MKLRIQLDPILAAAIEEADPWDVSIDYQDKNYPLKRLSIAEWKQLFINDEMFESTAKLMQLLSLVFLGNVPPIIDPGQVEEFTRSVSVVYQEAVLKKNQQKLETIATKVWAEIAAQRPGQRPKTDASSPS